MRSNSARACVASAMVLVTMGILGCGSKQDEPPIRGGAHVHRSDVPNPPDSPFGPWFFDATEAWGLAAEHRGAGADDYFFPAIMSAGAAFLDYDMDGDLDVLLATGCDPSVTHATDETSSAKLTEDLDRCPRLYRQDPNNKLVEVTREVGLNVPMYCSGVAVGDVNNDGFPDIYLSAFGPDRLLLNNAGGGFSDVTQAAGIDNIAWGASVAMLDYDRDGWLDICVTNYVDYFPGHPCIIGSGKQDFCNPAMFLPTADKLYRNLLGSPASAAEQDAPGNPGSPREPRFADASFAAGIGRKTGPGLGVVCSDFNRDGWPDIYIANDGERNCLWINQGNGTFVDEAVLWGCSTDGLGKAQGSMGVAVGDPTGDQNPDLYVTNLDGELNMFYTSVPGDESFGETSGQVGFRDSYAMTGFGTVWLDVDVDGDLDMLCAQGRVRRRKNEQSDDFWSDYKERNHLYLQDNGQFARARHHDDAFAETPNVGRALAMGDIDNDGDMDLLLTVNGGPARLLENRCQRVGHWLSVLAVDANHGGRVAIGSEIEVRAGKQRWWRDIFPSQSYLSTHDPRAYFGLGDVDSIDSIEVRWPDGIREQFVAPGVDQVVTLKRGEGTTP